MRVSIYVSVDGSLGSQPLAPDAVHTLLLLSASILIRFDVGNLDFVTKIHGIIHGRASTVFPRDVVYMYDRLIKIHY